MNFSALYWREAGWLWLTLLPFLMYLLAFVLRNRKLTTIADTDLLPWVVSRRSDHRDLSSVAAFGAAWILFCVAMAGPRTPQWVPPELRPASSSVVFVLDLSASMQADDLRPSRRAMARAQLQRWVRQTDEGVAMGLAVFSGHGHLLLPPTVDHKLALHLLRDLDALQLPTLGNNLAEALQYSITALQDATGKKSIFLLSDGDIEPAAIREAAILIEAVLIKEGISLFIAGTGGVEKVALPAALVPPALADNRTILTRREEGRLLQLAEAVNGQYYPMEKIVERDLPELLQLPVIKISAGESERVLWNEWFGIPLLVGLLLLFAGLHFSCRINNRLATSLLFLVMPVLIADHPAMAAVSAEEVLASGDYRQAKTLFMQQEGYSARFGEGTACYRLKDFLCARQAFSRAAWEAGNSKDRGRAAFNLGNTHFQLGEFEEAAVLFAEAERNGVPARIARRNHEFAIELAISVRKYLTHIELTKRKADWMANARDIPEGLLNRLTEGITFENDKSRMALLKTLSREQLDQLLRRGVARALGKSVAGSGRERAWAATESLPPESSIGLFNRLLPLEAGLNVVPETPYAIEGQRPW